jgi:RNA polymerase sigma-70 factor, ECF subfamily
MKVPNSDLLRLAGKLDPEALGSIYDRYSPAIYRYAARLLGDSEVAEECVAETFHRLLLAFRSGGGPDQHLQAYLYRIAHNWITDRWRRQVLQPLPLSTEAIAGSEADPVEQTVSVQERCRIRAALGQLTPEQREVVTLKFLENLDNEEIAKVMNRPVGAIKALQHRALASLRRLLSGEGDIPHE